VLLVALDVSRLAASDGDGHGSHAQPTAATGFGVASAGHGAGMLAMMLVMTPLVAWNVRYVALRAPALLRVAVVWWVAGGWAAVWGFALVLLAAVAWLASAAVDPVGFALVASTVAVWWQSSTWKRVALARCHRVFAPPLSRAAAGPLCRGFGFRLGRSCAVSCGPMMLLMVAGGHSVAIVAPLTAVAWYERRRRPHHDPARAATSLVVVLVGAGAVALAAVAAR
jgi:hypothetical protein